MTERWTASVTFRLGGENLIPEEWTEYFGVEPEEAYKKGDMRKSGNREIEVKCGVWFISLQDCTDELDNKIRAIFEKLKFPREDFLTKITEKEIKADFFCYWEKAELPEVADDLVAIMNSHDIYLDVDWYYSSEEEEALEAATKAQMEISPDL